MKLSIFTTISNPEERQDPWHEATQSYLDLADEVVVVEGGLPDNKMDEYNLRGWANKQAKNMWGDKAKFIYKEWPENFEWKFIGEQFQRGYEACTGDWVIHADIDYFFHENDFKKIREALEANSDQPALSFWKYQFLLVDRYNLKSRCVIAVNKKKFGDRIKFNGGGDLCQPTLDGKLIESKDIPEAKVPFYNYDFCFKELPVINKDWKRFRSAWDKQFGKDIGEFKQMMVGRFNGRGWEKIDIMDHPQYIRDKIAQINPKQFGFNMFGWIKEKAYHD